MVNKPSAKVFEFEATFGIGFAFSGETGGYYIIHMVVFADEQIPPIMHPFIVETGKNMVRNKPNCPAGRMKGAYNPQTQILTVYIEKQKPN